jgi:hypothetical protein
MQMGPVGARYQGKGLKFIFNLQPTFGQPKTGVELAQAPPAPRRRFLHPLEC